MKFSTLAFCFLLLSPALFTSVYSQEKEATAIATAVPVESVPRMGPITVIVDLIDGQKISGTLTDASDFPFKTSFGEVKIPLSEIAGIKFAYRDDASTTIILKNGDSITGAADVKSLAVDTEWGGAKINGSSVISMLLLPDLKWNSSVGLNGKRWTLVDSKNIPATIGVPLLQGTGQAVVSGTRTGVPVNPAVPSSRISN